MGKKKKNQEHKEKSKNKKQELQQIVLIEKSLKSQLQTTLDAVDILESFNFLKTFQKNGLNLTLSYYTSLTLPPDYLQFCFNLVKDNMHEYYSNCVGWSGGWNDKTKMRELKAPDSRFLILNSEENTPVAFTNFRFLLEDEGGIYPSLVLYLFSSLFAIFSSYRWEIHVIHSLKSKGIGSFLMRVIELIGWKYKFDKVKLTAFKDNKDTLQFYQNHLHYQIDDTSPEGIDIGYCLLSKIIKKTPNTEEKKITE